MPTDPARPPARGGAAFEAVRDPSPALAREAAASAPHNAMLAPAFADALRAAGRPPLLLMGREGGRVTAACYATLKQGRARRTLAVESWPGAAGDAFSAGFVAMCDEMGADVVEVETFGSEPGPLPAVAGRAARRARLEHVWPLDAADLRAGLASNHKRNVTRAAKAGVQVVDQTGPGARALLDAHARLAAASLTRRAGRGEQVHGGAGDAGTLAWWRALSDAGSARVVQARAPDGEVVSSLLVLLAERGAYYQSAGTSPRGMELGASPFLVLHLARQLAAEGRTTFTLGGAEEANAGLHRFKTGFGTRPVPLEALRVERARSWRARALRAVGAARTLVR